MTHYFLYKHGPIADLGKWIEQYVIGEWSAGWQGKVKSKGWMSVRAAIAAIERNESLSVLLRDCIAFGGDVDTVATIALAAASCSDEYIQDLPRHLIDGLENGPFGREYLQQLDVQILSLVRG